MEGFFSDPFPCFLSHKFKVFACTQTLEHQGFDEKKSRFLPTRLGEEAFFCLNLPECSRRLVERACSIAREGESPLLRPQ